MHAFYTKQLLSDKIDGNNSEIISPYHAERDFNLIVM